MSDGALSQAEIDALLSGVDSSSLGGPAPAAALSGNEDERKVLQSFLGTTVDSQSANLSKMTGATVKFGGPQVSFANRDSLLEQIPDMVTSVKADFTAGFPGEHIFIMGEETAKSIASLMNKEDNIELDEMSMSVIGEVVSQLVGSQITALTNKTGNKSIASGSPEAANVPKAVVALPSGTFPLSVYQLDLGDGKRQQLWEVYGANVSAAVAHALQGGASPKASAAASHPTNTGMPSGGYMGGMSMQGMGAGLGGTANVQPVQFPNLMPHISAQEQGNIGLIMDVFMEMTVELGRTKKLIKDILGMGEGTIIELDKLAGEPVDILVNHKLIAKGEVVVIDENFGVRVTEIVSPMERMGNMD